MAKSKKGASAESQTGWEHLTASPEETEAIGQAIAACLKPGDAVALLGDLGSGKTTFVRGVAQGLGCGADAVKSPTFVLVREYPGPIPLVHVDAYRLAGAPEAAWLDIELIFDPDKVTVVEWAERFGDLLPAESLSVRLEFVSTKRRRIRIDDSGEKAVNAIAEAKAAVARLPASGKSEDGGSAQETSDVSGD